MIFYGPMGPLKVEIFFSISEGVADFPFSLRLISNRLQYPPHINPQLDLFLIHH